MMDTFGDSSFILDTKVNCMPKFKKANYNSCFK